jgi:hypothetical protein
MHFIKSAFLLIALTFVGFPAHAAEDFAPFIGEFAGKSSSEVDGVEKRRDLSVDISETKDGFNVSWTTTTFKKDKPKTKSYSIDFIESDREHIYQAAQKKNVFGGREPLDPMKGDAYAWARVEGQKLTIYALVITEDGGFEMQTYDRILLGDDNLHLKFSRIRDGETLKTIDTNLYRQ